MEVEAHIHDSCVPLLLLAIDEADGVWEVMCLNQVLCGIVQGMYLPVLCLTHTLSVLSA